MGLKGVVWPVVPRHQWAMAEPFGPEDWNLTSWNGDSFLLVPITPRARVVIGSRHECRKVLGQKLVVRGIECSVYGFHHAPNETLEIGVCRRVSSPDWVIEVDR